LHGMQQSLVLQATELEREQLSLDQFRRHDRQFLLHQLEAGDRLAKLHASLRVLQRRLEARARRAIRAPGDAVARLIQAGERAAQALDIGQHILSRYAAVGKMQLGSDRGAQGELLVDVAGAEAGGAALDQEAANAIL